MTVKRREVTEVGGRIAAPGQLAEGQRKLRARLIAGDIQGSSGYYTEAVIERDGPTAFPVGTKMHLDHQSFMEMWTKPEGSLKDLAAVIYSTPVYERSNPMGKGLYADVLLFSEHADMLIEMAPYIGLSIVAVATSEEGPSPATGELTDIITEIIAGVRVDFVTFPGADGRITEIIESHRVPPVPNVPGSKEITEVTPLTGESAGSKKKGAVKMAELTDETANALKVSLEALAGPLTALTSALTTEAAARQAKESGGQTPPNIPEVIRTAVKALAESGLPQPSQDRVIEAVTSGRIKSLAEAITEEKAYLESVGVRFGQGAGGQHGSTGNSGSSGAFVADSSNGAGGGDPLDIGTQWWLGESASVKFPDSTTVKADDLLAAFGG